MKRNIFSIGILLSSLCLLVGCEKELMDYEGEDCLYFDVRRGATWISPSLWSHYDYSEISFGNLMPDEVEMEMSFKVMASGMPRDYDRPFTITANPDSTTAIAGTDYDNFQQDCVIKAGENSTTLSLKVHRTKRMDGDTLLLQLQLHENEYFKLKYDEYGDASKYYDIVDRNTMFGYNKNAGVHNLFIYDVLARPAVWSGNDVTGIGLFGKFSAKKFRLMMELSGTTLEDYASSATMPSVRQQAIGQLMAKYLLEKAAAHDPVLDEDGTMMYFMALSTLDPAAAWAPFTKPEDYYK